MNPRITEILMQGYTFPAVPRIGSEHRKLYRLEDERNEAIRNATEELAEILGQDSEDFFKKTIGESLYAILDNYDTKASILVCVEFLKRQGFEIKE